jgi:iron complex outermembrane receptor protein
MKKLHATFASGVSLAALLCSASISHAQTAPTAPAVADPTTQLDEVIVTATRRSERLQDVPGSVSAVSGELLDALKVKTLADFAAFTPASVSNRLRPGPTASPSAASPRAAIS